MVVLHGLLAEIEQERDLAARQVGRDEAEDFGLARAEVIDERSSPCKPLGGDLVGDVATERPASLRDNPDRTDQLAGVAALGDVAQGTGFECIERERGAVVHGEHQDAGTRVPLTDVPNGIRPAHAGRREVYDDDVRPRLLVSLVGRRGGIGLDDYPIPATTFQQTGIAFPDHAKASNDAASSNDMQAANYAHVLGAITSSWSLTRLPPTHTNYFPGKDLQIPTLLVSEKDCRRRHGLSRVERDNIFERSKSLDIAIDGLDFALLHFAHEQYKESNDLLSRLDPKEQDQSFIAFCVGRNHFFSSDIAQAREWFERSRQISPVFQWTYYELSRLLDACGDISAACQHMASFIRVLVDQCKTSEVCHAHIVEMVRIAHKAFEHDRGAAVVLYKLICALGIRDYLSELRVVESQLDAERLADATITMQELMGLHTLDSWGLLVLSRVQFAEGNHRLASETIATVVNADESGSLVKSTAIHTLLSFGLLENADNSYKELLKNRTIKTGVSETKRTGLSFA